jgi:hypothetical protein
MTQPDRDSSTIQALRARNTLVRDIKTGLKGSGLDIRERDTRLVITDPGHPEHGRIHVTYATGDVTHQRTTWEYLGQIDGHSPDPTDPDAEPPVTPHKIIKMLTGPTPGKWNASWP